MDELKGMIKQLAQGVPLTSSQLGVLEEDPRATLAKQQKQLNIQRKSMNKERGLETKLRANEDKYVNWATTQKALLKSEKERFEAEQQRLEKELNMMRHPTVEQEEMSEEELEPTHGPTTGQMGPTNGQMEARVLQAEQMAWETQQAFLTLQSQLQVTMGQMGQMLAGQGSSQYAMPPQPNLPAAPPMPAATPPGFVAPLHGAPSPRMTAAPGGSPQLPKHTRVAPQPGTSNVAKSHLKTPKVKDTQKERDSKLKDSPSKTVEIQENETIDLSTEDEPSLL